MRTEAARPGASVTAGHPGGAGEAFACQPAGDGWNTTPDVMGCRFPSSSVIPGVPCSVHVVDEKLVTAIAPIREPAAPCIDATARSCPDVHGWGVVDDGDADGRGEVTDAAGGTG